MDLKKIERVLRSRTFDMFSDLWYKRTSTNILDLFIIEDDLELELNKKKFFEWFSENIKIGHMYNSKHLYLELNSEISQKKMTTLIQEYASLNNLIYKSYRTHNARNFILNYK